MAQKFESELAKRVADRGASRPGRRAGLLFGAVAVCAMLSVSALYSVAMSRESGAPVLEDIIFHAETAYLTEEVSDGETAVVNVLALRHMNLKVKGDHLYAEESSPLHYAKFVYGLSVVIVDPDDEEWEGMALGELTLPDVDGIAGSIVLTTTATVTRVVDGLDTDIPVDHSTVAGVEGNVVTVDIPTMVSEDDAYASGDSIWISVAIETGADLQDELNPEESSLDLDLELVTEIAWGDSFEPTTASAYIDVEGD